MILTVVLDTTKVQIFKQITTLTVVMLASFLLFQIPQRYRFSSKSQHLFRYSQTSRCCFRYHKGTDFQANHNYLLQTVLLTVVVLDTTKVQIFKQITTYVIIYVSSLQLFQIPQRYRFSSKSQLTSVFITISIVVLDTTKVQIFKQITTALVSQFIGVNVVLDTTKVQIFKQITTRTRYGHPPILLFQIPQRYRFSSKSQLGCVVTLNKIVVLDTTKVQIFKQITTQCWQAFV